MARRFFQSRLAAWIGLSTQEMKGFVLMLLAMTLVLSLPVVFDAMQENRAYNRTADEALLDSLLSAMPPVRTDPEQETTLQITMANEQRPVEPFNPNELDAKAWEALGLKPYLAMRMVKYREKVSPFRTKKDLLKVYGFPEPLYRKLAPFILLPEQEVTLSAAVPAPQHVLEDKTSKQAALGVGKQPSTFDLNTADTTQLIALKGIGAVMAGRIIRFRDALGGFYSTEQLNEVYGITPEALASLASYTVLQPDSHRKIRINTADVETLKRHPYIGYKLAQVLVNYRQQHGSYKTAEDLQAIRILTPEKLQKLLPYIDFSTTN
ncbi:MAG: helix-hairpin-helix domain-containing protein [Cytophagales bacterium]|nr:helix-hairpin-helix domain-containing protein [Bernardetiaceae bacterium]MDW8204605.1 helix-hairpin-helix domain-containing protein [Cytophagales bacterium]